MKLIDMLVEDGLNGWQWPDGIKCITQDNGSPIYKGVAFGYYREPTLRKNIWLPENDTVLSGVTVKRYDVVADDWATAIITREQYEAALAAKNDGWIEWGGGECPVGASEMVDVIFGRGGRMSTNIADCWRWSHSGTDSDIIAYRLHKPQVVNESDDEADLNECIGQDVAPVWSGEGLPPVGCECELKHKCHDNDAYWGRVVILWRRGDDTLVEYVGDHFKNTVQLIRDTSKYADFRPIRSEADKKREDAIMSLAKAGGAASFKYGEKFNDGSLIGAAWYELYDAIAAGKVRGVKLED